MKIDFSYITDVANGRTELLVKLLKTISANLEEYPINMQNAFDKGDYMSLGEIAHKYKSSVGYLGNEGFTQLLTMIDQIRDEEVVDAEETKLFLDEVINHSASIKAQIDLKLKEF
ncbi:Hpt domain-containing protein [Flammeovirgaceae bacterium SG7u.111]|nr:Hpt domain-containing protein [Flammeovirgaceae bacterium SG7u.132]WPO34678.1 Hpt domain-containing protein [Flammeovirgaceae bacterium SG7u.111]